MNVAIFLKTIRIRMIARLFSSELRVLFDLILEEGKFSRQEFVLCFDSRLIFLKFQRW